MRSVRYCCANLAALALGVSVSGCMETSRFPTDPRTVVTGDASRAPGSGAIVLRGTVLTPDGVIEHGYVSIVSGRIASVSDQRPDAPDAVWVNADGIILPGFVDLHNHVPWNVLPRWRPSRQFAHQSQWANDPEFQQVRAPFDHLQASSSCDMNAWGELRALVGGTTSIMATFRFPCIHGLVRNLDFNSGFYGTTELDREHIFNVPVFRFPPPADAAGRAAFVQTAQFFITNPSYEALAMHVAEGTDAVAEEQFTFLQSQSLLNSKGILIHGISLGSSDFQAMAAAGTALVWSPRSNQELYGTTANIAAALAAGVEIALAPDWALTGSSNMLDELKTAAQWNRQHLGDQLSDRQLVDMVTAIPARVAGVDDEIGTIQTGLHADLLVIGREDDDVDPYHAVVEATPANIELVVIDGVAIFGDPDLMKRFWAKDDLQEISLPGARKELATPVAGIVVEQVATRLQAALMGEGASLAPLTEPIPGAQSSAVRRLPAVTSPISPTAIRPTLHNLLDIRQPF